MKVIIHDPGHGGLDPGAVANGTQEKKLTWTIANKVIWYLNTGWECDNRLIQPSIENSKSTSKDEIYKVVDKANTINADLFISYHINAGGGTGFESYIARKASQQSKDYQNAIHSIIADCFVKHGLPDRGEKAANFYVIANTNMPAILFELGFIDNAKDRALLTGKTFIEVLSKTIAEAIAHALDLPKLNVQPQSDYKVLYEQQLKLAQKYEIENREMRQVLRNVASMFSKYMIE